MKSFEDMTIEELVLQRNELVILIGDYKERLESATETNELNILYFQQVESREDMEEIDKILKEKGYKYDA